MTGTSLLAKTPWHKNQPCNQTLDCKAQQYLQLHTVKTSCTKTKEHLEVNIIRPAPTTLSEAPAAANNTNTDEQDSHKLQPEIDKNKP